MVHFRRDVNKNGSRVSDSWGWKNEILFSWLTILLNSFSCVFYSHEHAWMFGYLLIGIVTEAYSLGKNFQMWIFSKSNFMTIFKSAIKNLKMIIFTGSITGNKPEETFWAFKTSLSSYECNLYATLKNTRTYKMSKYLSLSYFTSALFCIFSNISGVLTDEFFYKSPTCNQSWWLSLNHRKVFCWRIFVEHSDVGDKDILMTNRETESFSTISSLPPIFFIINIRHQQLSICHRHYCLMFDPIYNFDNSFRKKLQKRFLSQQVAWLYERSKGSFSWFKFKVDNRP